MEEANCLPITVCYGHINFSSEIVRSLTLLLGNSVVMEVQWNLSNPITVR